MVNPDGGSLGVVGALLVVASWLLRVLDERKKPPSSVPSQAAESPEYLEKYEEILSLLKSLDRVVAERHMRDEDLFNVLRGMEKAITDKAVSVVALMREFSAMMREFDRVHIDAQKLIDGQGDVREMGAQVMKRTDSIGTTMHSINNKLAILVGKKWAAGNQETDV